MINPKRTIRDFFLDQVENRSEHTALLTKLQGNEWREISWGEIAAAVRKTLGVFRQLGIEPGERLVLISGNRLEWIVFDLACMFARTVHVPLHAVLSAEQWHEQIALAESRFVFVFGASLATQLVSKPLSPALQIIVDAVPAASGTTAWQELYAEAESLPLERSPGISPEVATIMFTSGTTGQPKGVMLTHANLAFNAQAAQEMLGDQGPEVKLNLLPFSHSYARTADLYLWLLRGSKMAIASRESLLADFQAICPTHFNAVPYVFEQLQKAVVSRGQSREPVALKQLLGGNMRSCSAGGAPLNKACLEFFTEQHVPLLEGYGLTETSPIISLSTCTRQRAGSCGQPLPGVELQIAADGELLTRGPHVMAGYFHDPAATQAVMSDGWFHTGDLAEIDDDGFLWIRGRKKELIVLSTGKKVSPQRIEQRFHSDPQIAQFVVVGEGRPYLSALLALHEPARFAELEPLLRSRISQTLADLSATEQISSLAPLPRLLSAEHGEITAKLSYCRPRIALNHAALIDSLYSQRGA